MAQTQAVERPQAAEPSEYPVEEYTRSDITYRPNVDILEQKDELIVLADLPGVSTEDIDIQFEQGVLTLQGHVRPRQESSVRYLRSEYGVGSFYRSFRVSERIDASKIRAEFGNGVLTLHLPKVEAVKPRRIEVRGA